MLMDFQEDEMSHNFPFAAVTISAFRVYNMFYDLISVPLVVIPSVPQNIPVP